MTALALLALLLRYPDDDVIAARAGIAEAVARLDDADVRQCLERFLAWFTSCAARDAQTAYVDTFDFGRRTSLHLTFPSHGDRRERGVALLRIKGRYAAAGLHLGADELPDHLAVMVEFAGTAAGGATLLDEHRPAIELLRVALHDQGSPYVHLLDAVCASLPVLTEAQRDAAARLAAGGPPSESVGLEPFAPADHVTGTRR